MHEPLAVAQRFAVDVVDADIPAHARVGDVHLLIVGREADAVGSGLIVGDLFNLQRPAVHAVHGFLRFRLAFEAFVVAADPVPRVREPDAAVGMHGDVVR